MQPYFFPYLGHFGLIAGVDRWVVFDVTQYTPKSWMNRNRVLHPSRSWMYVTVPVCGSSQSKTVQEVMIHDAEAARSSVRGKLAHYRRHAPYYERIVGLVEQAFSERQGDRLLDLDVASLRVVCEYLGINFDYEICSEMGLDLSDVAHPGQWAVGIARQIGATEYVNPLSGAALFRPDEFHAAGVRLRFFDLPPMLYETSPYEFEPSLSAIDVLMWNDPAAVRAFIRDESRVVDVENVSECPTPSS